MPIDSRGLVELRDGVATVDARYLDYRALNTILRGLGNPEKTVHVMNVLGQRYIGTGMKASMELHVHGTPGNDLAAFMDGGKVVIHGNAQDGAGNTMNGGTIVVHGRAGDIAGYSMRGGEMYIRDDVGYRCGIHMKQYGNQVPTIVVGGAAQDYLGEYMAGGILVVMGLTLGQERVHRARFAGTGMHGGVIYLRGKSQHLCGDVQIEPLGSEDLGRLNGAIDSFVKHFGAPRGEVGAEEFMKLVPRSARPYGEHYAR